MARNLWAERCDLNFCRLRSRRRITRCEFSARLFCNIRPDRWRSLQPSLRTAARYEASLSVTIVSGWMPWCFSNLRSNLNAAMVLRRFWTSMSKTSLSSSTARQSHIRLPEIFTTISSKCQRPVGLGPDLRRFCAKGTVNLIHLERVRARRMWSLIQQRWPPPTCDWLRLGRGEEWIGVSGVSGR